MSGTDVTFVPAHQDKSMRRSIILLAVSQGLGIGADADAQPVTPPYQPRQVLKAPMPAITKPVIVMGDAARVPQHELVLCVLLDGEARAYRINELTGPRREVINDQLGGVPIAATW